MYKWIKLEIKNITKKGNGIIIITEVYLRMGYTTYDRTHVIHLKEIFFLHFEANTYKLLNIMS